MEWQIYKALQVHQHENNVREHYYCIKEIFDLYNTKERLEKLKHGKMPKEYKQITQKGVKKFNAKESFINDKELQREYENRSYASQQLLVQRQKQE